MTSISMFNPVISFITGDGAPKKGKVKTWGYYPHDIGYDFCILMNSKEWDPDQSVYLSDNLRTNIEINGNKFWVELANVSQREDWIAERERYYSTSFCIIFLYSALSMDSFKDMQNKIEEAKKTAETRGFECPPMAIIGTRYHRQEDEIEAPFETAKTYAETLGIKAYQTYGKDKALDAINVIYDIITPFTENGMLVANKEMDSSFAHSRRMFYKDGKGSKISKRSRCTLM